jgi:transposase
MILNGLGFAHRPLSFTPPFFANKPLDLLFREGVCAERFNRFPLGRTLDEVDSSGWDGLLSALALAVCAHEGMDVRFNPLDPTSFSLSGDYGPASDEPAIRITPGDSQDSRPDLQQAVVALMVSQDGGGPCVSPRWDGNTSDTKIFQERAAALLATLQRSPTPRYVVADSKRYPEDHAATLRALGFSTRMPTPLNGVSQVITPALRWDTWQRLDDTTRYQRVEFCHDGMAQRCLVVSSEAAVQRAEAPVSQATQRAAAVIEQPRFHVHAQRFETPEAAQAALATRASGWT